MGPLGGLRILELAGIGAGPHCAMMLADMGAEVVRIDRPAASGLGVDVEPQFDLVLRGRKSIAIDLKNAQARDVVLRMVAQADALLESFRPGVMERIDLGPDDCFRVNTRLVYARLTGWGQDGPYAQMAGHDINYIALTGALNAIGPRDGTPVPPLNLVGDFGGGALHCAFGMVCALLHAQRTGEGQVIDAAMVDGAAALATMVVGFQRAGIWTDRRGDNIVDGGAPYYATYETADGRHVALGAMEKKFYALLLEKLGLADDAGMTPHTDRARWPYQRRILAERFKTGTRDEWCALLEGTDACFAPVLSFDEAAAHPHLSARRTFADINGVSQPAPAPRLSRTQPTPGAPPAVAGEHSTELLRAFGFDETQIAALLQQGVVVQTVPAEPARAAAAK